MWNLPHLKKKIQCLKNKISWQFEGEKGLLVVHKKPGMGLMPSNMSWGFARLSRFCLHRSDLHGMGGEGHCQFWCHIMLSEQERLLPGLDPSPPSGYGDFWLIWLQSYGHLCSQPRMGVSEKVGGQHHPKLIGWMGYCGGEGDSPREGMLGSKSNFHRAFTGFLTMFPGRPFFFALPCATARLFPRASLAAWPTGTSLTNSTTLKSRIHPCKWLF